MAQEFKLYILPVSKKVIFPYQSLNIRIPDTYDYDPKKFNSLIGLVNIVDEIENKDKIQTMESYSRYGTILKINSEEKTYYTFQRDLSKTSREIRYYGGLAFGRFKVKDYKQTSPYYLATIELLNDELPATLEKKLLAPKGDVTTLKNMAKTYISIIMKPDLALLKKQQIEKETSVNKLVYTLCGLVEGNLEDKIILLQCNDINQKIKLLTNLMNKKNDELKDANDMENKVRKEMEKESLNVMRKMPNKDNDIQSLIKNQIQGELDDIQQLEKKIKEANLPQNVYTEVLKEYKRFKGLRGQNAEANVIRTYIENVLELPWNTLTPDRLDLKFAEDVLNRDHSGLEIVKKRILEFLAVRFLKGNAKGTIICLAGPPGVGKTSLGKSIAESLNRKFERIALGGVRDEAQVRGHRRTYVGALPGVFIQAIKKVQSRNPVILLDEIDKVSRDDMRGDPSSALLEVLDPAQNNSFTDHYLALPFDLSSVMFIATANNLENIQPALLDRMEIIQIPGYTDEEKKEIAQKYLLPRQIEENGINPNLIDFRKEAIDLIVKAYTREPGVRQLERKVGALCRKVAVHYSKYKQEAREKLGIKMIDYTQKQTEENNNNKDTDDNNDESNSNNSEETQSSQQQPDEQIEKQKQADIQKEKEYELQNPFKKIVVDENFVRDVLGVEIYDQDEIVNRIDSPGVALGMAWTQAGGKVLVIESSMSKGKGRIELTGQLGDVMKESVKTALGWIKSNANRIPQLPQSESFLDNFDIHVHFPAASIPKDGPSAGITITTALVSLLTGLKIKQNVSMTGEISLKGHVLPVGGIKEKCLAAYASGISTIIIPYKNKKDTNEISDEIKKNIKWVFAQNIEEVLEEVFEKKDFQILKENQGGYNKLSKL